MRSGARIALVMSLLGLLGTGVGPATPAAAAVQAQLFKSGLADPAGFTFAPDGRVFYGERSSGEIHILAADGSTNSTFFTIPAVVSNGEQGVLGIALHPDYPATPSVFVYATRNIGGGQLYDQIVRITDNAGTGENLQVIFQVSTTSGSYHDGGRILFGPDGKLYAVVGDGHSSRRAQNLNVTAGKVLRMNADGTAPADNPFPGKLIWSYGLRNSFGFDFDPATGRLWESENGPECNDEVNRIIKGRNYGWGRHETCGHPPATPRNTNQDGPNPVMPKRWYTSTIAPAGMAFCAGCGLGAAMEGRLLMAAWNTGQIRAFTLTADRKGIASQSVIFTHVDQVISTETAPDGSLYFSDDHSISKLIDV